MSSSTAQDASQVRSSPVPRGERRRREIAAVAERVFFAHGFAETTMQIVAAEAGASKETLYRHFGSKEGLFSEIVEHRANHFLEALDENLRKPGGIREVLYDLGLRMLGAMMGRDTLCLSRIVIGEGVRNPELGRLFFERGPERVQKRLAQYLAAEAGRGEIVCADPVLASRIFMGGVVNYYYLKALVLPGHATIGYPEMQVHTSQVVAMFLACYGVPQDPARPQDAAWPQDEIREEAAVVSR